MLTCILTFTPQIIILLLQHAFTMLLYAIEADANVLIANSLSTIKVVHSALKVYYSILHYN